MKSKLFLIVVLLTMIPTVAITVAITTIFWESQQSQPSEMKAEESRVVQLPVRAQHLVGVKGVHVMVGPLQEDVKLAGLTREQLKTDVESKIRQAGIKVYTQEEWLASEDQTRLYVNVSTTSRVGFFGYSTGLQFSQNVYLARKPNRMCPGAITWYINYVGTCDSSQFATIARDKFKDQTDGFINDYLTANPNK